MSPSPPDAYGVHYFEIAGLTEQSEAPTIGGDGFETDAGVYEAVPEPTSLALVGLGAAVVALRRRFAKKA